MHLTVSSAVVVQAHCWQFLGEICAEAVTSDREREDGFTRSVLNRCGDRYGQRRRANIANQGPAKRLERYSRARRSPRPAPAFIFIPAARRVNDQTTRMPSSPQDIRHHASCSHAEDHP